MAIVDKTHSQTIEEAFSQVAEGGSGGGELFVVTATMTEPNPDGGVNCTVDKTAEEIIAAIESGAHVVANVTDGNAFFGSNLSLKKWGYGDSWYEFRFAYGEFDGSFEEEEYTMDINGYSETVLSMWGENGDSGCTTYVGGVDFGSEGTLLVALSAVVSDAITISANGLTKVTCSAFTLNGEPITVPSGGFPFIAPIMVSLGYHGVDDAYGLSYGLWWWDTISTNATFNVVVRNTSNDSLYIPANSEIAVFMVKPPQG